MDSFKRLPEYIRRVRHRVFRRKAKNGSRPKARLSRAQCLPLRQSSKRARSITSSRQILDPTLASNLVQGPNSSTDTLLDLSSSLVTDIGKRNRCGSLKKNSGDAKSLKGNNFKVRARLPEDDVENSTIIVALLDTGCERNLMSVKSWNRVNKHGRGVLEPVQETITPLQSKEIRPLGLVRNLTWNFVNGYKTYTTNFYVLDMDEYDALIGCETIERDGLLTVGDDLAVHIKSTLDASVDIK